MARHFETPIGISEIAKLANVSRQVVTNWRARSKDFPQAIAELKSGSIFNYSQVRAWLRTYKRSNVMTHVISTINLKGGVGKTTTSVALAEVFSAEMKKKVLVIDIDPQTNATMMLIGESKWAKLNKEKHTLAQLFEDALSDDDPQFSLDSVLQTKVSDVSAAHTIDLLPSSLDLIDVQDRLAGISPGKFYANNPIDILKRAVKPILPNYDLVIIDCPPNLGIITLNALRISEGYIIPTIPDHLSTYGIPQIVKRTSDFAASIGETIDPLGIVITKYQATSTVHRTVLNQLQNSQNYPNIYDSIIRQGNAIAAAAEFKPHALTFRQKYGSGTQGFANDYIALANEIWTDLEGGE